MLGSEGALLGKNWASRGLLAKHPPQAFGNGSTSFEGLGLWSIALPLVDGAHIDVAIAAYMVARALRKLVGLERIDPSGKRGV